MHVFDPVLCVSPFDAENEVIVIANDRVYGLSSAIHTTDLSR
ncbi:aldehyde dehydrogenase family protein [Paraburkholderia sp. MM6662-R1]